VPPLAEHWTTTGWARLVAEDVDIDEHLVVSTVPGVWRPLLAHARVGTTLIATGQEVGVVESLRRSTVIHSPFSGTLMAFLVADGERVRPWQPLLWLHVADGEG
jgi:biotin carboxyl carrier protein